MYESMAIRFKVASLEIPLCNIKSCTTKMMAESQKAFWLGTVIHTPGEAYQLMKEYNKIILSKYSSTNRITKLLAREHTIVVTVLYSFGYRLD